MRLFHGALVGHPLRRALMPLEALAVYHTLLLVPTSAQPYSYAVADAYIYMYGILALAITVYTYGYDTLSLRFLPV